MKVSNWNEAEKAVIAFANGRRILWGVGNYDPPGCVVAVSKDAWSGDGMGYYARVAGSNESFEVSIERKSVDVLHQVMCHPRLSQGITKMKHTLTKIGYLGAMECYLDVPEDECIKRYMKEEGESDEEEVRGMTETFEFEDHFSAYAVYPE